MHRLVVLAIIAALGAPARADVGAAMVVHASSYGGLREGGGGVMFEVSRRRGRLEYFGDLGVSAASGARGTVQLGTGLDTSLLGGVRVIARTFAADESAISSRSICSPARSTCAGNPSMSRDRSSAPAPAGRCDCAKKTIRMMTRLFAAPTFSDREEPVCRGACPEEPRTTAYGFMGMIGASW